MGASLPRIFEKVHGSDRRVVFAEGEEETSIRAALAFQNAGYGIPILVGREELVHETLKQMGVTAGIVEVHNARLSINNKRYTEFLYQRLQRRGSIYRDCQRLVNQNRNVFAACMVATGDADAM